MDAFSLLNFWRIAPGDDATVCGGSKTTTNDVRNQAVEIQDESDDEDSFFDLEFTAPRCDEKEQNDGGREADNNGSDSDEDSCNDLEGRVLPLESNSNSSSNSKPQSPISFLRSPPKFPVFMLFKKPKSESKRLSVKCKAEEVPIFSLLTRENSSRSKLRRQSSDDAPSKRFPKDVVQKYLKLIKPLYVRVSKRYSEKLKFSDQVSTTTPSSSPEKQGSRVPPLRVVCKHLEKSRSASSATGIMPSALSKREQQHDDGIQSAILHCKRSYNSSREFSVLCRSTSDSSHEISINPSRNSTEEVKKRSSI